MGEPNLERLPETSHNINLGLQGQPQPARFGAFTSEVNGFVRVADRLIAQARAEKLARFNRKQVLRSDDWMDQSLPF